MERKEKFFSGKRERETAGCAHSGVSYKGIEREKEEEEEDGGCWEEERVREQRLSTP